jgi:hypothetical protein
VQKDAIHQYLPISKASHAAAANDLVTGIGHEVQTRSSNCGFSATFAIGAKGQHRRKRGKSAPNLGLSTMYHCGTANAEKLNREFKMGLKKASVAAVLAVSMASTPVLAQSAAPLSVAARSGATTSDENNIRGGFIIPVIAVVAIILGILAATGGHGSRPHSP